MAGGEARDKVLRFMVGMLPEDVQELTPPVLQVESHKGGWVSWLPTEVAAAASGQTICS